MLAQASLYNLELLGPLRLFAPGGARITITSKKGTALLAMLAMAPGGERGRNWLQDRLWGSREDRQAQSSLRREVANLRACLDGAGDPPLHSDRDRIRLDLSRFSLNLRAAESVRSVNGVEFVSGEFLEGIDIAGEDVFEDWLRDQRSAQSQRAAQNDRAAHDDTKLRHRPADDASTDVAALRRPAGVIRPVVQVSPITNLTGDVDLGFVAEGISDDVVDRLARTRWLRVASGDGGKLKTDRSPAVESDYLITGRLRRTGKSLNLGLTLSDTKLAHVIWSHRFDLPDSRSFDGVDALLQSIVAALDERIDRAHQIKILNCRIDERTMNGLIWRGRWHLQRMTTADDEAAQQLFTDAVAIDPESSEALIQLATVMVRSARALRSREAPALAIRQIARQAIADDSDDGRGYFLAGMAECWLGGHDQAKSLLTKAIGLNPSLPYAHLQLGQLHYLNGEPHLAVETIRVALSVQPDGELGHHAFRELAMAYFMLGDWKQAIDCADLAIAHHPAQWITHVVRTAALVRKGRYQEAHLGWSAFTDTNHGFARTDIDEIAFADKKWNLALGEAIDEASGFYVRAAASGPVTVPVASYPFQIVAGQIAAGQA